MVFVLVLFYYLVPFLLYIMCYVTQRSLFKNPKAVDLLPEVLYESDPSVFLRYFIVVCRVEQRPWTHTKNYKAFRQKHLPPNGSLMLYILEEYLNELILICMVSLQLKYMGTAPSNRGNFYQHANFPNYGYCVRPRCSPLLRGWEGGLG